MRLGDVHRLVLSGGPTVTPPVSDEQALEWMDGERGVEEEGVAIIPPKTYRSQVPHTAEAAL